MRPTTSTELPAVNGIIALMGRAGQACARTTCGIATSAAAVPARRSPSRRVSAICPPRATLFDELVGVELLDRRRLLDEALRQIEVLQLGEPRRVHLAEHLLSRVDRLGVHLEREPHAAFLAFPLRHEGDELVCGLV